MKLRLGLVCALAGALAIPVLAQAGSTTDRATGGGQVLVGDRGAGDTIAFTARGTSDAATGEVQYVDRDGGTGQGQSTYHGNVECLDVEGNRAKIAGTWESGGPFNLYVVDNGQGSAANDDIVTVISQADDPSCDFDDPQEGDQTALARGNAQVYDASGSSQSARRSKRSKSRSAQTRATSLTYTKALTLAGLR
jgi:hypothetical protein